MRINVVTLFPEFFKSPLSTSLLGKALEDGIFQIRFYNPKDFGEGSYKAVDDYPYGGGGGMLLSTGPLKRALDKVKEDDPYTYTVFLTPKGVRFNQRIVDYLRAIPSITLVCGRYEGFDERLVKAYANLELSLGDFITMGGEVGALAVIEALVRLIPGATGNPKAVFEESFTGNLLEYPQYTRPKEFMGMEVPEVLLSGDHKRIEEWREEQAKKITKERRPDLLRKRFYLGLVHYPVYGKHREIIGTSIVPFDVHDLARLGRTYGASGVYIITPFKQQQAVTRRLIFHWTQGYGSTYNETRREALGLVRIVDSIEDAIKDIEKDSGFKPLVISTTAREGEGRTSYQEMRVIAHSGEKGPFLYLFGTGWGLTDETLKNSHMVLEPIRGFGYNHLSVRSAASIIIDRIYGV